MKHTKQPGFILLLTLTLFFIFSSFMCSRSLYYVYIKKQEILLQKAKKMILIQRHVIETVKEQQEYPIHETYLNSEIDYEKQSDSIINVIINTHSVFKVRIELNLENRTIISYNYYGN